MASCLAVRTTTGRVDAEAGRRSPPGGRRRLAGARGRPAPGVPLWTTVLTSPVAELGEGARAARASARLQEARLMPRSRAIWTAIVRPRVLSRQWLARARTRSSPAAMKLARLGVAVHGRTGSPWARWCRSPAPGVSAVAVQSVPDPETGPAIPGRAPQAETARDALRAPSGHRLRPPGRHRRRAQADRRLDGRRLHRARGRCRRPRLHRPREHDAVARRPRGDGRRLRRDDRPAPWPKAAPRRAGCRRGVRRRPPRRRSAACS